MTDALRMQPGAAAPLPSPLAAGPLAGTERPGLPAGAAAAPANEPTSFRALLERLQKLASPAAAPTAVATADDLRDAVRAAESSFTTAMDLRRQLEEAFRRHAT